MPKKTFLELPDKKRRRIEDAARKVFLTRPFKQVTISDIVKEAKIPRGSFYQYFEHLEDLYQHIFALATQEYEKHTLRMLEEKQGRTEFFEFFKESFAKDYAHLGESDYYKLMRKFFEENLSIGIGVDFFQKRHGPFYLQLLDRLDTSKIKGPYEKDIFKIFRLLSHVKMQLVYKAYHGDAAYEESYEDFLFYVELLEKGIKEE